MQEAEAANSEHSTHRCTAAAYSISHHMPSRVEKEVKVLECRYAQLQRQLGRLSAARQTLQYQSGLLDALCSSFATYYAKIHSDKPHNGAAQEGAGSAELQLLQMQEHLLQELAAMGSACTGKQFDADPHVLRIAPRNDPLALFKELINQPAVVDAALMTSTDLAQMCKDTVQKSSLQLHSQQLGFPTAQICANDSLQNLWLRYFKLATSIITMRRPEVVAEALLIDMQHMRLDPEGAAADRLRTCHVPSAIGLTQLQLQDIADGTALFAGLLGSILQEQAECHSNGSSISSCSSSSSSGPDISSLCDSLYALKNSAEAHSREARRLHILLHKEYAIRLAASAWFVGCLSWEQYTRIAVLHWPFAVRMPLLAHDIAELHKRQLLEREQQQLQQAAAKRRRRRSKLQGTDSSTE